MMEAEHEALRAEVAALHDAARGREFDLVPEDGPIAQLALFMHQHGDRIVAALATGREGWRTIEMAPRDGSTVLLWGENLSAEVCLAYWAMWRDNLAGSDREGWREACANVGDELHGATHWRYPPAPPSARLTASALDGSGRDGDKAFELEWIGAARPPAHPKPMTGRQSFATLDKAAAFWKRQPADATLVRLTERTTHSADRTAALARPTPEPGAPSCVACEGRPSGENNPCAVCGKAVVATFDVVRRELENAPAQDGGAATVPPGYVLVPEVPTGPMVAAAMPYLPYGASDPVGSAAEVTQVWSAMLAVGGRHDL